MCIRMIVLHFTIRIESKREGERDKKQIKCISNFCPAKTIRIPNLNLNRINATKQNKKYDETNHNFGL